jgi:hypothetical protein
MSVALEVHMSEEELELLITTDDPGEDSLEEDTFHLQSESTVGGPFSKGGGPTRKQKVIAENDPQN